MTPLGPGEMRAHARPFVVLAIAGLRLVCGLCLAWPLAALLAESGASQTGRGDRVLFESGGYLLLEVLRVAGPDLLAVAHGLIPLVLLGLLLMAACNAALMLALNLRGKLALIVWVSQAAARVPAFVVVGLGSGLTQLVCALLGALLIDTVPETMTRPAATTALQLALWLLLSLVLGAVGSFSDVVKAALVRHEAGVAHALTHAARCARRAPLRTCLGFLPYALAFLVALWGASKLTSLLDVSAPGAWRVALVFGLHQAVIICSVALRAAWFARALRLAASV
ncbi:MAG TPA: hypothetical protein VJN18_20365 [Polyangiaceae bacterium]|nr:hypothetical protein [Polyangiaceae bacterium]